MGELAMRDEPCAHASQTVHRIRVTRGNALQLRFFVRWYRASRVSATLSRAHTSAVDAVTPGNSRRVVCGAPT